ncbi:MAG: hypothetical protein QW403_01400 [Candidatus Aenigmatarchaeota archaeon]
MVEEFCNMALELVEGISSYSQLKDHQSRMIEKIVEKSKKTPIYRDRITEIKDVEELPELPLTFYEDIKRRMDLFGVENCLLAPYKVKIQTAGSTGIPKQFYYGKQDLEKFAFIGARCGYFFGLKKGDIGWSLTAPPPYISGLLISLGARKIGCNLIDTPITSGKELIKGLKKISKVNGSIRGMYGFPSILISVAEISNNPTNFKNRIREKITEKIGSNFLSHIFYLFYTSGINFEKIKHIIENVEIVISAGEPLPPYKDKLKSFFTNAKLFDAYGSSELGIGMIKLLEDGFLHPMLDWFIPEIADPLDIRRVKVQPNYEIKSIPWWEWYKGLKGELIITRDGECLPLIRYPTGDLVEVVDPAKNISLNINGATFQFVLPEVKILGRSVEVIPPDISEDEMLTYSIARIYPSEIKLEVSKSGIEVLHHNLFIYSPCKSRPFPRWRLEIIPKEEVSNKEELEKEIKNRLIEKTEIKEAYEPLSLSYSKEFIEGLFEVKILTPDAYKEIENEIEKRVAEGKPLGQLKPKHIHFVKEE